MALARSEKTPQRFYSMSAQICRERNDYYDMFKRVQKGDLDITPWIIWFVGCLERAIQGSESVIGVVFAKRRFWERLAGVSLNERECMMLNKLLDGFTGKLTTAKWASIAKCSHDTALRDIHDLMNKQILVADHAGGRSTSYALRIGI